MKKFKMLEPIDGYEDVVEYRFGKYKEEFLNASGEAQTWGFIPDSPHPCLILTPKIKYLDWTKCDGGVEVTHKHSRDCVTLPLEDINFSARHYIISDKWQAHMLEDKCPVDPDACWVEVRKMDTEEYVSYPHFTDVAGRIWWDDVTAYRVIKLIPPYKYPG